MITAGLNWGSSQLPHFYHPQTEVFSTRRYVFARANGDTQGFVHRISVRLHELGLTPISDPACGTCRKKCRKCDRARPICNRCKTKGLHCEGYPPKFQFCAFTTAVVRDIHDAPRADVAGENPSSPRSPADSILAASSSHGTSSPDALSVAREPSPEVAASLLPHSPNASSPLGHSTPSAASSIRDVQVMGETECTPSSPSSIDEVLLADETQALLLYCKLRGERVYNIRVKL